MQIPLMTFFLFFFNLLTAALSAQDSVGTDAYRSVNQRSITSESWNKAAGNIDYSNDRPEKTRKDNTSVFTDQSPLETPSITDFSRLGTLVQIIAVMVVVGLLGWWIYRMISAPSNKPVVTNEVAITPDNLDAYIHETDLDGYLRDALARGEYNLAIRVHYLQIIRALSEKKHIRWSREKTNREYLRELGNSRIAEPVRNVTGIYERIWYGNRQTDQEDYLLLAPDFMNVLRQV